MQHQQETNDGFRFDVTVDDAGRHSTHVVTLSRADYERSGSDGASATAVVRRCVEFVLERVSQSDLMDRFDLREALQLYPEFESEVYRRLE